MMLLLALAACSPGASDTGSPDYAWPVAFSLSGAFAYDPETGTTAAYRFGADDPSPWHPWIDLAVTQADSPRRTCSISVHASTGGLPAAPWASEAGARFGFRMDDAASVGSGCSRWDPETWGDPTEQVAGFAWGLGVGDMDPALLSDGQGPLRDHLIEEEGEEAWDALSDKVLGGRVHWGALDGPGQATASAWALGYRIDEDFVIEASTAMHAMGTLDADLIPREEIEAAEVLPRGLYVVVAWDDLDPEDLLR